MTHSHGVSFDGEAHDIYVRILEGLEGYCVRADGNFASSQDALLGAIGPRDGGEDIYILATPVDENGEEIEWPDSAGGKGPRWLDIYEHTFHIY